MESIDPVAEGIPNYTEVVQRPMDLNTVQKKLTSGEYAQRMITYTTCSTCLIRSLLYGPFCNNMFLGFDNAMQFNKRGTIIHTAALTLHNSTLKNMEAILEKYRQQQQTHVNGTANTTTGLSCRSEYSDNRDSFGDEEYLESNFDDNDDDYNTKKKRDRERKVPPNRHHHGRE